MSNDALLAKLRELVDRADAYQRGQADDDMTAIAFGFCEYVHQLDIALTVGTYLPTEWTRSGPRAVIDAEQAFHKTGQANAVGTYIDCPGPWCAARIREIKAENFGHKIQGAGPFAG